MRVNTHETVPIITNIKTQKTLELFDAFIVLINEIRSPESACQGLSNINVTQESSIFVTSFLKQVKVKMGWEFAAYHFIMQNSAC